MARTSIAQPFYVELCMGDRIIDNYQLWVISPKNGAIAMVILTIDQVIPLFRVAATSEKINVRLGKITDHYCRNGILGWHGTH